VSRESVNHMPSMEFPTGCLPRDYWKWMFNLTEDELNGQSFARLGYSGTMRLESCRGQDPIQPLDPFNPLRIL